MKAIKNLLIIMISISLTGSAANAQEYVPVIEVKTAPIQNVIGFVNIGAEYVHNDMFGVEANVTLHQVIKALGKVFISPKYGADRWYIGSYLRHGRNQFIVVNEQPARTSLGFIGGYKLVTESGIIIEFASGIGRVISYSDRGSSNNNTRNLDEIGRIDGISQLSIGYRFGTVKDPLIYHGKLRRKERKR